MTQPSRQDNDEDDTTADLKLNPDHKATIISLLVPSLYIQASEGRQAELGKQPEF